MENKKIEREGGGEEKKERKREEEKFIVVYEGYVITGNNMRHGRYAEKKFLVENGRVRFF